MGLTIEQARPLAPLTTLELGGAAEYFVQAHERDDVREALAWSQQSGHALSILGAGSNLVVADAGVRGLVMRMATCGIEIVRHADHALVTAQAGESFQDLVQLSLDENLAGLECLNGIPGLVGATPIQNVGAYGQEVSDTIDAVEVLDRQDGFTRWLSAAQCGFGYRVSQFKQVPGRQIVLAVRYRLTPNGKARVVYPELARALSLQTAQPSLREVAQVVWSLRASKSMVLDRHDENGKSAGSFFTNPIVTDEEAKRVRELAVQQQIVQKLDDVPCYDAGPGYKKLAAGFLIERAGVVKGLRRGAVGVSSKHALSLVHHGGGTTAELLALADEIKTRVVSVFGVQLELEPVRWG